MTRRPSLALHWQILIGLALGVVVGLVLNLTWGRYTWGALGVGDAAAYKAGEPAARSDAMPPKPGPAIQWLVGTLEDYTPASGAPPLEAPKNAYTARVVDWLVRPVLPDDEQALPDQASGTAAPLQEQQIPDAGFPQNPGTPASQSEGSGADGSEGEGPAAPKRSDRPPHFPLPEGADLEAARAWLLEQTDEALGAFEDKDESTTLSPLTVPEDPELRESVAWLAQHLSEPDPNTNAGFTALVPRFVANLNGFIGDLFVRGLRFIAVPIVLFSLVVGASSLNDLKKLSRIGGKTIGIYLVTTAVAISVGLMLANAVRPGKFVPEDVRDRLAGMGQAEAEQSITQAEASTPSTWDVLLNIVPSNPFEALARAEMLQIVFFALVVGIALTLIKKEKAAPIVAFCDGMTDVIIKLVHLVMLLAPYAVFALIVRVVADLGLDVLGALAIYSATVIGGLALMVSVVYPLVLRVLTPVGYGRFFGGIAPAQLLAFSSASSSATLPVTMECAEERLGVSEEVSSFVLPLGATINMDGTALYQGIAAVFIAQLYGLGLDFGDQLTIVLTATLASIGTAGVPGVGMIMLVIVLQQLGFSPEVMAGGIAIIFGVDRLLDMCRTTCNVTGDLMVCSVVAASERELLSPEELDERRARLRDAPVDEHPHEGSGTEYGVQVGSEARPIGVADRHPSSNAPRKHEG